MAAGIEASMITSLGTWRLVIPLSESTIAKAGRVEYRADKFGIAHVGIGKASFDATSIVENYVTVLDEVLRAKPASTKGKYIKSITLTSTMGPGVKVDPSKTRGLLDEANA